MTSEQNSSRPGFWRRHGEYYQMIGEDCQNCRRKIFPPRGICPECGKPALGYDESTGWGRINSAIEFEQNGNGKKERRVAARITLETGWIVVAEGSYQGPHLTAGTKVYVSLEEVKNSLKRVFRPSSQMAASKSSK